jgi:hypothetical protein
MESDIRTQVVSTGPTLIAATAWLTRFNGDTLAHSRRRDSLTDFNYLAGRFVSQDQRAPDHEIADAAVLVIVGAAQFANRAAHIEPRWSSCRVVDQDYRSN